jgi:hypothetical protein
MRLERSWRETIWLRNAAPQCSHHMPRRAVGSTTRPTLAPSVACAAPAGPPVEEKKQAVSAISCSANATVLGDGATRRPVRRPSRRRFAFCVSLSHLLLACHLGFICAETATLRMKKNSTFLLEKESAILLGQSRFPTFCHHPLVRAVNPFIGAHLCTSVRCADPTASACDRSRAPPSLNVPCPPSAPKNKPRPPPPSLVSSDVGFRHALAILMLLWL